jgi:hypothetical protein
MSNAINALDKEDQENLQFILQKMYPESKNFKELLPTVKTLCRQLALITSAIRQ